MYFKNIENKLFQEPSDEVITEHGLIEITEEEFNTLLENNRVAAYNELSYAAKRSLEYPSLEEQEDMKYWDAINGTTVWLDTITAIKEKYPKPDSI